MTAHHRISYASIGALGPDLRAAINRVHDHAEVESSIWIGDREYPASAGGRLALHLDLDRHHNAAAYASCIGAAS